MSELTSMDLPPEEAILAFTHHKRMGILGDLLKAGTPSDPENIKVITGLLTDMDRSALTRKRIKVDEKSNAAQEANKNMVVELLKTLSSQTGLRTIQGSPEDISVVHTLPDSIPKPDLQHDELSTTISTENFDDFMARMEKT